MKPSKPLVGVVCGLTAAVCYGLIPLFTIPIQQTGTPHFMPVPSILFYRFFVAALIVALLMLLKRRSFRISRSELVTLTYLAFLSDGAALFLIEGYPYMSSGVATTLHFLYPVFTAVIMMAFYHEARQLTTILAVTLAVAGVGVLSFDSSAPVGWRGVVFELISAVCFALYIIRVNRSHVASMDALKLSFYVMLIGSFIFGAEAFRTESFQLVETGLQAADLLLLGVVCTVVTNVALVYSVKYVGSTMASVLGALEPLTAVIVGCIALGDPFTWQTLLGLCIIVPAVILIVVTRGRK